MLTDSCLQFSGRLFPPSVFGIVTFRDITPSVKFQRNCISAQSPDSNFGILFLSGSRTPISEMHPRSVKCMMHMKSAREYTGTIRIHYSLLGIGLCTHTGVCRARAVSCKNVGLDVARVFQSPSVIREKMHPRSRGHACVFPCFPARLRRHSRRAESSRPILLSCLPLRSTAP